MSAELVRELFRNFENNLRDRLKVIEDILITSNTKASAGAEFSQLQGHLQSLEEYAMGQVRTLAFNHDQLENRVVSMESTLKKAVETLQTITSTIGSLQKRMDDERPVEAVEAEVELEETQEAALNADVDASATETKAKVALAKAVEQLQEEEEEEEEVVEEEEEEVVEEEEEEVEEEQEVEEEEEVEELELEEFQYKTKTYYRDQNSNVYIADEDGCVDANEVVGIWNPKTKKIERLPDA